MNIVLGEVKEVHLKPADDEHPQAAPGELVAVTRSFDMLFVRGDSLVLAAPLHGSRSQ